MTHEGVPNEEHDDGPEHDDKLPDARDIETFDNAEDSDLPALVGDVED